MIFSRAVDQVSLIKRKAVAAFREIEADLAIFICLLIDHTIITIIHINKYVGQGCTVLVLNRHPNLLIQRHFEGYRIAAGNHTVVAF